MAKIGVKTNDIIHLVFPMTRMTIPSPVEVSVQDCEHRSSQISPPSPSASEQLAILLQKIHDSHGKGTSTIVSAACLAVFTKHRKQSALMDCGTGTIDRHVCEERSVSSSISKMKTGKTAAFVGLITLDPELFFKTCERVMEEKRPRDRPKETALVDANLRAEILRVAPLAIHAGQFRQSRPDLFRC